MKGLGFRVWNPVSTWCASTLAAPNPANPAPTTTTLWEEEEEEEEEEGPAAVADSTAQLSFFADLQGKEVVVMER